MVVHCKAGVGRTGTFILAHYILEQIKNNIFTNPIELVKEMRKSRAGMIQGYEQFNFAITYLLTKIKPTTNYNGKRKLNTSFDCCKQYYYRIGKSTLSKSLNNLHI